MDAELIEKLRAITAAKDENWVVTLRLDDFATIESAINAIQAAELRRESEALEILKERDDREEVIDEILNRVLGYDRPEWSCGYGYGDAIDDVENRMAELTKPATPQAAYAPTLCDKCGEPTMHLGRTCYSCSHKPATPQAAQVPEDTARLDFIERTFSGMTNRERYLPVKMIWGAGCNGRTLREACDKYMALAAAQAQGVGRE